MDTAKVAELKQFISLCKSNPGVLQDPSLSFFNDYLRSLGAEIPRDKESVDHAMGESGGASDDEIIESDIELDEACLETDNDPPQQMGDPYVEVSEESRDAAQLSKAKAMDALSEGNLEEAVQHLTEAIISNPTSAILHASRASIFLKMNKPNAAIRDADAALQINPDSAKGYKSRGMARAMLGQWEEAAKDLHVASNLDYDEEIAAALKKVEPNAHKIEEHRRKYERLRKEREMRKAQRERQRRQAEAEAKRREQSSAPSPEGKVLGIYSAAELEVKMAAAAGQSQLVVLYFTAAWCGPCRFMGPVYESLAGKYPGAVFMKIDIDELGEVAEKWGISSVPAFFLLKDGKEVDRVVGADKAGLERKVALHSSK